MLFWCFIMTWFFDKIRINGYIKLIFAFLVSILAVVKLPFQINTALHYWPFFYLGVIIQQKGNIKTNLIKSVQYICAFLLLLIVITVYRDSHEFLASGLNIVFWYVKQLYATFGTIGIFIFCKYLGNKFEISDYLLQFNTCCFGVYIFHQFILEFMYYHTTLPLYCGSYILPWCGLIISFGVSFGLTYLLRRFNWGRFLLG